MQANESYEAMRMIFTIKGAVLLSSVAVGTLSLWMGYSLFLKNIVGSSNAEGSGHGIKVKFSNIAPGVFFAGFGAALIATAIAYPLTHETFLEQQSAPSGSIAQQTTAVSPPSEAPAPNTPDQTPPPSAAPSTTEASPSGEASPAASTPLPVDAATPSATITSNEEPYWAIGRRAETVPQPRRYATTTGWGNISPTTGGGSRIITHGKTSPNAELNELGRSSSHVVVAPNYKIAESLERPSDLPD